MHLLRSAYNWNSISGKFTNPAACWFSRDIYHKLSCSRSHSEQTARIQNKSWLKLMPRAGDGDRVGGRTISCLSPRVTHQNNPDSLIMSGLMCGSLPGTTNNDRTEPGTSFASSLLLFFFVHFCHVCVQKDLCTKRHPQPVQDKQARTVVRERGKGSRAVVASGFYEFP